MTKLHDGRTQDAWVKELAKEDNWNERHALALFGLIGVQQTYLDVGSGTGAWVNIARKLGTRAWGVDQLERPEGYFFQADLREPFSLAKKCGKSVVDLVTCFEVAEHLPPECDNYICDTCASHVRQGGLLFWTSAYPGQGGHAHIGIRPNVHWHDKFHERGLTYVPILSRQIALLWSNIDSRLMYLSSNIQVFAR